MKLHFESDLEFQLQAIESVCDLFSGQEALSYRVHCHATIYRTAGYSGISRE